MHTTKTAPVATWIGLAIALFAAPLVIYLFNRFGPAVLTNSVVIYRELSVLAVAGLLLLLVKKGEKLGMDSIGLRFQDWSKSIRWGLLGLVVSAVTIAILLFLYHLTGIQMGQDGERYKNISLWVILLMVFRAGTVEEICYRGYVIERLEKMTHNWLLYFLLPLLLFGALHYRQGIGGILISFFAGLILAAMYVKKRDLKANILTHFLVDFIPNVLFPLLGGAT